MTQCRSWQTEQELLVADGKGIAGDLERTAVIGKVTLPWPGGHIYTPQALTSRWWAEPLAG